MLTIPISLPSSIAVGMCWIGFIADPSQSIVESDETNNTTAIAGGCHVPGTTQSYGQGCGGRGGRLTQTTVGAPAIGSTLTFRVSSLASGATAVRMLGLSRPASPVELSISAPMLSAS